MEQYLEEFGPHPNFPGKIFYKNKLDGFMCTDHLAGPEFWKKIGNNYEAIEDDIYIVSLPRTGTTWTTELIYLIANNLDYEKAKKNSLYNRSPYLNFPEIPKEAFDIPSPRCIRTHLPYSQLPKSILDKKCKIIYTLRNPKDTLTSYYHFSRMNSHINFVGDFDTMVDAFLNELLPCNPFWKHVLQYWEHRNDENVLILGYEERKKNMKSSIQKLAAFLGKNFKDEHIRDLEKHCSFDEMKANPSVNMQDCAKFDRSKSDFIRKGEVGDWKNYFSKEQSQKFDEYFSKHLKDTDLEFIYEL